MLTYKCQNTFSLFLVVDEGPASWQLGAAEATLDGAGLVGDLLDTIIYQLIGVPLLGVPGHLLGLRVHPGPDSGGVGKLPVLLDMVAP